MEIPLKFNSVIQDPDYLDSLKPQNVLVINFSPTIKRNCVDLDTFISEYEARQHGIISRLVNLAHYLAERQILSPFNIDKEAFLKVCHHFNVSPNECLMVGDNYEKDLKPAEELGMKTIDFSVLFPNN